MKQITMHVNIEKTESEDEHKNRRSQESTTCDDCRGVFQCGEVNHCSCGARVCKVCYQSWHREHNRGDDEMKKMLYLMS